MSSCLLFELYKEDDSYFMQLFYKNSTATKFPALEIPNCSKKCPLEKLYEIHREILPTKAFDEECALEKWEILAQETDPEVLKL